MLVGNERYEGFIPDMVHIIAKVTNTWQTDSPPQILHFNVTLRVVADGNYGSFDGSRWNGMMQEVGETPVPAGVSLHHDSSAPRC